MRVVLNLFVIFRMRKSTSLYSGDSVFEQDQVWSYNSVSALWFKSGPRWASRKEETCAYPSNLRQDGSKVSSLIFSRRNRLCLWVITGLPGMLSFQNLSVVQFWKGHKAIICANVETSYILCEFQSTPYTLGDKVSAQRSTRTLTLCCNWRSILAVQRRNCIGDNFIEVHTEFTWTVHWRILSQWYRTAYLAN